MEEVKAAMRRGPEPLGGIQITFDDTPNQRTAIPTGWGKAPWVTVKWISGAGRILFGDAAVACDRTATGAAPGQTNFGFQVASAADNSDWELKEWQSHIAGDAAASLVVEVWLRSGKGR